MAWAAFWKLEKLWKDKSVPIETKTAIFNTTCVSVLLYGCESWVLSQEMKNKISSFATSCYRIMLNIKRTDHVPNSVVHELTKTHPLMVSVIERQLKFLGHILRMEEAEPVNTYALYVPTHGKRKRGRPAMSYLAYIQQTMGDTFGTLSPKQLKELAQVREAWRTFVVDCSTAERW